MEVILLRKRNVFASNCYIIISEIEFSVIDPSVSYSDALMQIPKLKDLKPIAVLLTHAHIDHIFEIDSYVNIGMQVFVSLEDADKLSDRMKNAAYLFGENLSGYFGKYNILGDDIAVGNETLSVIKTPGHTSGSVCFLGDGILFSGDTLFENTYGRYDLYSGSREEIFASLRMIFKLSDDITVYPGHAGVSTIRKIKHNFDN